MIINTEYGNFDITKCSKYVITNYKDCVLHSGVVKNRIYVKEETHDDLDEVLEYMNPKTELNIDAGTHIGIFNCSDEFDDDADCGFRLDGEIKFNNSSIIYHDGKKDCTGEISRIAIILEDNRFIDFGGEYSIITKKNGADELSAYNNAVDKDFNIIILCPV